MSLNVRGRRRGQVLAALILAGSAFVVAAAQQTAPVPRPPAAVTANFTGSVRSLDAADVRAVRFQYDAGARS